MSRQLSKMDRRRPGRDFDNEAARQARGRVWLHTQLTERELVQVRRAVRSRRPYMEALGAGDGQEAGRDPGSAPARPTEKGAGGAGETEKVS